MLRLLELQGAGEFPRLLRPEESDLAGGPDAEDPLRVMFLRRPTWGFWKSALFIGFGNKGGDFAALGSARDTCASDFRVFKLRGRLSDGIEPLLPVRLKLLTLGREFGTTKQLRDLWARADKGTPVVSAFVVLILSPFMFKFGCDPRLV